MPEDIVLIAAGFFVFDQKAHLSGMIVTSLTGVLLGDYLIFIIGRKWGIRFLNHKIFKDAFREERIEKVHKYFDRYGNKTIFLARFVWGIRAATFFIAGTHTMSAARFLFLDFLGAIISIPIIIYIANYFGSEIGHAIELVKQTNKVIIVVIIAVLAILIVRHHLKLKKNKANL